MNKQLVMILCLLVAPAMAMGDGFVLTTTGERIEGQVVLERGKLIVKPASGGEAVTIPISEVKRASFGKPVGKAAAEAKEKPVEPLKPRRVEGLRAEYFADHKMSELKLVRVDRELNLWWGSAPDPAVPKGFAVRWTGVIEPKFTEKYTFEADLIGGMKMWVDGRLIVDQWDARPGNVSGVADLKAGTAHAVRIEFHDALWAGLMRLFWSSQNQSRQVVPAWQLHPPSGTVVPAAALREPRDSIVFRNPDSIWIEGDSDNSANKLDFFIDDQIMGTVAKRPWRIEWAKPPTGYHKAVAQATNASGISSLSEPKYIAIAGDADGILPQPWMEMPIAKLGSAPIKWESRRLTMEDSFGNLWSQADGFRYVFQAIDGDGSIAARIDKFDASNEEAAAGLLLRENQPTTRCRAAFLGSARDGLQFRRCENYWQEPMIWDEKATLPCWLKLSRYGRDVKAYVSDDGKDWKRIAAAVMDLPKELMLGFVVGSPGREPSRATFEKVSLTGGPPQMAYGVKGVVLRGGSIVGGAVRSMDDSVIKIATSSGEVAIPRSEVALVVFQPATAEMAEALAGARQGALMNSGDFIDGEVQTVRDGMVGISSVLFGARKHNAQEVVVAALRGVSPQLGAIRIELNDGSILQAGTARIAADRLEVSIGSGTSLSVVGAQIAEIKKAQ
ncbi:MAG TPA: PA14 domain-containing protein [Tepidisphaeraceae bacterium]|nr:PA14 domain-containing protein [Tepidisphaeraceae bacterium]